MDEQHLAAAYRYSHLNPARARLVDRAEDRRTVSTTSCRPAALFLFRQPPQPEEDEAAGRASQKAKALAGRLGRVPAALEPRPAAAAPYVIEFDDLDAGRELRFNALGLVEGRTLFIMRSARLRIKRAASLTSCAVAVPSDNAG